MDPPGPPHGVLPAAVAPRLLRGGRVDESLEGEAMNAFFRGAIPLCSLLLWPAPAPAAEQHYRAHPDYMARMRAVKTIGLVRPAMRLCELPSAAGRCFRPAGSDCSANRAGDALAAALAERGFSVTRVD